MSAASADAKMTEQCWAFVLQLQQQLAKETVCPSEPGPGVLCGVVLVKGFMHEIGSGCCAAEFLKTTDDLRLRDACEAAEDHRHPPDVALPNVSAFGVSATAQMAWTRFLIAEATQSSPWITELVIDSFVRTRSRTLPEAYISADDIALETLRVVTEGNEHQIATIGKGPGDAETSKQISVVSPAEAVLKSFQSA